MSNVATIEEVAVGAEFTNGGCLTYRKVGEAHELEENFCRCVCVKNDWPIDFNVHERVTVLLN